MPRYIGIDPSTKCGFVALDGLGNVVEKMDVVGDAVKDPERMVTLVAKLMRMLQPDDVVAIEGYAFGAQGQGLKFQYGLGEMIRGELFKLGYKPIEVAPAQLKKFATGKGNTKKDEMVMPIFRCWEFEHKSDNVRDAFVLAQIALGLSISDPERLKDEYYIYQIEVLEAIENPVVKKKKVRGA